MDGAIRGGDRENLNSNFQTDSITMLDDEVVVGAGARLGENPRRLSVSGNQDLIRPAIGPCGEGGELSGPIVGLSEPTGSGPMLIEEDILIGMESGDTDPMPKKGFLTGTEGQET